MRNRKFGKLSRPDIFLGIIHWIFKIWDMSTNGLIASKHVIFDDTEFPSRQNASTNYSDDNKTYIGNDSVESEIVVVDMIKRADKTKKHCISNELFSMTQNAPEEDDKDRGQAAVEELPRRYTLRDRVAPKRFVCTAQKCPQINMASLKEAMNSER